MKLLAKVLCAWLALGAAASAQATVRVGLWTLYRDKEIFVAPNSGAAWLRTCERCETAPISKPIAIRANGNTVLHDGKPATAIWLSGRPVLAAHGESLPMPYPLRITARDGRLALVVTMPLERYVERVVASESSSADSAESQKALAVVVRSFALHVRHGHQDYDLCDSTHCQLLHWGTSGRAAAAHAATLATAGETLWFHGRRAEAWFHQNSGGHTASPSEIWVAGARPMPWLNGQIDRHGTAVEWTSQLTLEELTAALASAGLARPGWTNLTVAQRGESGRAMRLRADATEITAEDFRLAIGRALGWNRIPSTWFEVSRQGKEFLFHGRGHGHGVGLSQAGAAAMAAAGSDYRQILAQYFPGATVADEATGATWQSFAGHDYALETLDASDKAYLPDLERAMQEAEQRSGLHQAGIVVRAFRSTEAFRQATLAPGWVAGFTEGRWIGVQPLGLLARRKMLASVMRHEMLHALVESAASEKTPLWLREGLAEAWNEAGNGNTASPVNTEKIDPSQVDRALAHADSEAESEKAHRQAEMLAARLLNRFGRERVLAWLHQGLPAEAESALR